MINLKFYFSCPVDDTVRIEQSGHGQEISFESFAFSRDTKQEIIVHCDIIACLPQEGCGVCSQGPGDQDP